VLTTAGPQLAPGLERRRRQLVLVLVLDSGVGRTLPLLLILQGPVVATLGAFYDPDHALVQGRGLFKGAAAVATQRRSHDDQTHKHDEHALVQGRALVQCLVVAILDSLCGCKHEDHARPHQVGCPRSLGKANGAKVGPQRHSASLVCLCAIGTVALAQERLVAAADASCRG
jgi:hypothetical protein